MVNDAVLNLFIMKKPVEGFKVNTFSYYKAI